LSPPNDPERQLEREALGPGPASHRNPNRGPLIAIGGAEDKVGDRAVLSEVVSRGGGKQAQVVIFPTASSIPQELAHTYETIFRSMGAAASTIWLETRADAEDPRLLDKLEGASVIFFTGGSQGRIVTLLGGTPLARAIRRAHRAGALVAGTSAGASVICDHMIAQGKKGYAPRRTSVTLAPGLGLTKRLVIDQHFAQRHRIGRLFAAVALNPFLIGVGIDEDTAIVIDRDNKVDVVGRGTVTIIDGSRILHTDIHETPDAQPAALLGMTVHVLTRGCGYDIEARRPTWQRAGQGPGSQRARAPGESDPPSTERTEPNLSEERTER
jgi:cyanophycinase